MNGDTGAIACDHYHLYKEDIKLMAELGIKHYRFSIAWSRIIPDGRGTVNEEGVDFYKRIVDCLNEYGITPHATLFHWDSPQALEDLYASWQNWQMAIDYADYVTAVVSRLGSRITHWMTINEISCFTHIGYKVTPLLSLSEILTNLRHYSQRHLTKESGFDPHFSETNKRGV